jgi:hypothetical protein
LQGTGIYQLIGLVIAAAIAFWVYNDAKKRPMNAILWAIGTFLVCIVFLPLYLILRKPVTGAAVTPGMPPQPLPLPPTYTPPPQQSYQQPPQYTPPPPTYTPPQPGAPLATAPPKQGKFCPSCGAPHEGTVKFCPNCGAAY